MIIAVFGFSVPVFVVSYILAYFFALELDLLPVQGYTPISVGIWPWFKNLILPSGALGFVYIALIARITRATMLEILSQDYIKTARAKGLSQTSVLFVHGLKNAAVPIITVIGLGIALLIGGAVVTESVFVIPGIGRLTIDAILRRDYPVIQGIVLLFSFIYVLITRISRPFEPSPGSSTNFLRYCGEATLDAALPLFESGDVGMALPDSVDAFLNDRMSTGKNLMPALRRWRVASSISDR